MSHHAFLPSLFLIAFLSGCGPKPFEYDRPLVEPTAVNRSELDDSKTLIRRTQRQGVLREQDVEWPALFGPNRTSFIDANLHPVWGPEGPPLLWEVPVGTGYGSPVTAHGKVVFNYRISDQEIVACHDIKTGEQTWEFRQPTTAKCDFEYSDGPYSTPIIDVSCDRVFNVSAQGRVVCLDIQNGSLVWSRELHQDYHVEPDIFPVGASPVLDLNSNVDGGQLIFNLGGRECDAGIISLAAESGETLWTATDHGPSYATPFVSEIHGQRFAFVLTAEGLVCLDPDSGQTDWEFDFQRRVELARNATSPMVVGDRVIVMCCGKGAKCIQVMPDRSFKEVWHQRRTIDSQYNTVIHAGDHLFSFTAGGQGGAEFRCVAVEDGELAWSYHSLLKRGMGFATANAIFVLGERGHLASFDLDASDHHVLSFTEMPLMNGPCYCSPAISGNLLILKDEQRIAAFLLVPDDG